jgi:DNA-binding NarL/FixJ family response regulator
MIGKKKVEAASPAEVLADREFEVYQMIGRGLGTRQIAEELRLGIKTVESYRARIREKLHLIDGDELRQHAIQWTQGGNKWQ